MDNLPAIRVLLEHDGTAVDAIAIDQAKGRERDVWRSIWMSRSCGRRFSPGRYP
jgi:hypothetical protein